jgi:hypothetical protein
MNFFCNRCNKKSEDNILNFNSTKILLKNTKHNLINNNILKEIETIEQFQNLNIGENITTSLNNLNNLEEEQEKDDELEIIEYPYSKEKKFSTSKFPKHFKNNESKFNNPNQIEKDILNQLNYFDNNYNMSSNKISKNKKNMKKIKIKDEEIERKDTMTDPANLALSSLIRDINNKKFITKEKNYIKEKNNRDEEEDDVTIDNEIDNNFYAKNSNYKKEMNNSNKIDSNKNNIVKTNKIIENKKLKSKSKVSQENLNHKNSNSKKNENILSKVNQRKISAKQKRVSEYNSNIMKKKNLLKNKRIITSNKTNLGIKASSFSSRKQFPKSYSFNYFNNEKKDGSSNELGYSWTFKKKNNHLHNNILKVAYKDKLKVTHKKVNRTQLPIQKSCSSHIASYLP